MNSEAMIFRMKILITGATGFIGSALVPKLCEKHKVVCFIRNTSNISALKNLANVEFAFGDILDKDSVFKAVQGTDAVLHLATSHFRGKEHLNLIGSKNIIEACQKSSISRVVFVSSMAAKRMVRDAYGQTKLEIENLFKTSGLDYTIIRPSIVYGRGELGLIGKSLFALPFVIPVIGDGKYKMNPVYIGDVVSAVCVSVVSDIAIRKEYDVAGAGNLSLNEIVQICSKQFGLKKVQLHLPIWLCAQLFKIFPIVSVAAVTGIKEDTTADTTALKKDLGVVPMRFEDAIKQQGIHLRS